MKIKPKVLIFSLLALGCLVLTFVVSYWFLVGAIIFVLINQRELMKHKDKN